MSTLAKVIADSIHTDGPRLTTLQLRFPRFILPQFLTHRKFSRNAASSRAIPTLRLIEEIEKDPVVPMYWGKNQKGMQAKEEVNLDARLQASATWRDAMDAAIVYARELSSLEIHKQLASRLLEPFAYVSVVCTSTEWDNFFAQRLHHDAQPEIQELASVMLAALRGSSPKTLTAGEWHLPYLRDGEMSPIVSAARCARVSYNKHDGTPATKEEDLALFERLVKSDPPHLSPTEHQAMVPDGYYQKSNLDGWLQFRKRLER